MKLRRLSLMCVLVLLVPAILVMPVSAGKPATQFTASVTNVVLENIVIYDTGQASHYDFVLKGDVDCDDDRLDGELVWPMTGITALSNPRTDLTTWTYWGPARGKWSIVTSAPGEPLSGWEGTAELTPFTTLFKESIKWHAHGNGFGIYKNLHVEWESEANSNLLTGSISR
jgi:hypothetical protein